VNEYLVKANLARGSEYAHRRRVCVGGGQLELRKGEAAIIYTIFRLGAGKRVCAPPSWKRGAPKAGRM